MSSMVGWSILRRKAVVSAEGKQELSVGHQGKTSRGVTGEEPANLGSVVFCEKGTAMLLSEMHVP